MDDSCVGNHSPWTTACPWGTSPGTRRIRASSAFDRRKPCECLGRGCAYAANRMSKCEPTSKAGPVFLLGLQRR